MSSDLDAVLLQENIEEFVNDENKVVTCRWLSLTLSININVAKQALYTFAQHQRNKGGNDDINVTYFVAGLGQTKTGDPIHKCVVVDESHLDVIKSSLHPVTSCHVYSVQKAKLKDYTALYQTDYDIIRENIDKSSSLGSIKCPWASLRGDKPTPATTSPVKEEKKPTVTPAADKHRTTVSSSKAKKPEPKGSIANMFANTGGSKKGPQAAGDSGKQKKVAVEQKEKPGGQKKGVTAFFGKQNNSKEAEPTQKKSPPKSKRPEKDSDDEGPQRKRRRRIQRDLFDSSDDEEEKEEEREEENTPMSEEEKEEKNEEEEEAVSKEQEEKEEEEEEGKKDQNKRKTNSPHNKVLREKVEEESKIVVTPGGKKRKRVRKLVPKQYVDDEGFMVTEKVWESDSTDVDEEEIEQEKRKKEEEEKRKKEEEAKKAGKSKVTNKANDGQTKKGPKKGTASPQKGKQTSLMSFFKKK